MLLRAPSSGGFDRRAAWEIVSLSHSIASSGAHLCVARRSSWTACSSEVENKKPRRYSPLLERQLLAKDNAFVSWEWKAVPDIWRSTAEKYGDKVALVDPYHDPPSQMTYKQLEQEILNFSEGLRVLGIGPEEKIALFADNSRRWLIADQGIMAMGAINVARGTKSSNEELVKIYCHSESVALVVDNPTFFNRLAETLCPRAGIKFVVLLWGDKSHLNKLLQDITVLCYDEIIDLGRKGRDALLYSMERGHHVYEIIDPDDIATLIYTSGTSSSPKGVMLTHRNLLYQINNLWDIIPAERTDRFLSMLPPWHIYERAAEYFILTCGVEQVYTTMKKLMDDLQQYRPEYIFSVPLIYEMLYSVIQKQISRRCLARKFAVYFLLNISFLYMDAKRIYEGKVITATKRQPFIFMVTPDWLWSRVFAAILWPLHTLATNLFYRKFHSVIGISKAGITAGGSLPMHIDRFFEAIGVKLQNAYGLTETSPAVSMRRPDYNGLLGNFPSNRGLFAISVDAWHFILSKGSLCNSHSLEGILAISHDIGDTLAILLNVGASVKLTLDRTCHHVYEIIDPDDIATLIYTSGTSSSPKGVMLTHRNLLYQINNLWDIIPAERTDRFLSMLPPWHIYERAAEYFILTCGVEQVYTTMKKLMDDLQQYRPEYIFSVPLIYEMLYSVIQKQISRRCLARKFAVYFLLNISFLYMDAKRIYEGKVITATKRQPFIFMVTPDWLWSRVFAAILWPLHTLATNLFYRKFHSVIGISKAGITAGGSLPMHIDRFFEAIGVKLQNAYGLTETSPAVSMRRPDYNVLGTVGQPMKQTEIKVVDSETGRAIPDGSKGIIKVRGPQVMKGYYKDPSATNEALDEDGWFSTGDIGWIIPNNIAGRSQHCSGMIVLEGRAKDTIVLMTGENVEPSELEEAAMRSRLIKQIVVIGQDQRRIGALIVPNKEELVLAARGILNAEPFSYELSKEQVMRMIRKDVTTWTSGCSFQIGPILILDETFTVENGLMTPTMKVRRERVLARYRDQIAQLYKQGI